ncbi:MAG: Ig-like domain-containing protein [Smithella sp.]
MKRFKTQQAFFALIMMLAVSVFLFTGCGSSDEAALLTAQFDNVLPGTCGEAGPKVNSSTPANNTENVAIDTTIMAYFSETMDPTTIAYTDQGDPQVVTFTLRDKEDVALTEGTVAMDVTNTIATFTPTQALHGDSWYVASVTTYAKNAGGTSLGCSYQWEFKTVAP